MSADTLTDKDWMIPGTRIKVPELLVLEGYGYSVPGHPGTPKRKNLHKMLEAAVSFYSDDLAAHDFMEFCRVRDAAKETWRLPGCEGGCQSCAPLHADLWDDPELVADLPVPEPDCDRLWWLLVPEGTTTLVSSGDSPERRVEVAALPWTDFETA